jgi:pyruvate dehydrogenase E2 component (dihydrolipoamide acetyltransferase)
MPALSPTMTEGTLAKWLKAEGDLVSSGDVLAEIETDKATMELEAAEDGVVGRIAVPAGTAGVRVNDVIAWLLAEGEDASAIPAGQPAAGAEAVKAPALAPAPKAAPMPPPAAKAAPAPAVPPAAARGPAPGPAGRLFASPLARRMAAAAGLDLAHLKGSGPRGRIVKRDVEAAGGPARPAAPAPKPAEGALPGLPPFTETAHTSMRKVIARRMAESKSQVPHFYLTVDCAIDRLLGLRKEINARLGEQAKVSVNDFAIRAVALALKRVPAANVMWTEAALLQFARADVAVAVAVPGGLITPIVRGADAKTLVQISSEMRALAEKARAGKLQPEEYQGGTITVSNLGMYGVKHFAAIINPPQACILAVGAGEQRAVARDGQLAVATLMTCTLAIDHRAADGAIGAEFLGAFKELIEDPLALLL